MIRKNEGVKVEPTNQPSQELPGRMAEWTLEPGLALVERRLLADHGTCAMGDHAHLG
jgi:hypothetical protein